MSSQQRLLTQAKAVWCMFAIAGPAYNVQAALPGTTPGEVVVDAHDFGDFDAVQADNFADVSPPADPTDPDFEDIFYVGQGFPQWDNGGTLTSFTGAAEVPEVQPGTAFAAAGSAGYNRNVITDAGSSKFHLTFDVDPSGTACTSYTGNCRTIQGCKADCEALHPDGLVDNLQGFMVYDPDADPANPDGDEQCFCIVKANSPISAKVHGGTTSGNCPDPTGGAGTPDCDHLFTYGYGSMDNNVNGGELSPSSQPSSIPSSQPSSIPSSQPSSIPSESPSSQPSSIPSEAPSSIPSESPSSQPSSIPSEAPSSIPSSIPSRAPSSQPSEKPSSMPSEQPSALPSCTPSSAPTEYATASFYYPDWTSGGQGCLNDGNEPTYMTINSGSYLYTSLDKCCSQHFSWNKKKCMNLLPGDCARGLWFPDWHGANEGCVNTVDEEAEDYMENNPMYYLYSNVQACCKEHYSWMYDECVGKSASAFNQLYYPDWKTQDHVCKKDGEQPQYMNNAPEQWMHKSGKDCCAQNFGWNYKECLEAVGEDSVSEKGENDDKYYPDWVNPPHNCKTGGGQPDYIDQNPSMWMYDTLESCCKSRFDWKYKACIGADPTADGDDDAGSNKWYINWKTGQKCVQDCKSGGDCGGIANNWDSLYDSKRECCTNRKSWVPVKDCLAD